MRKPGDKSWRDGKDAFLAFTSGSLCLLLVIWVSLLGPGQEKTATHYQVTAYQQSYGKWFISYFKFEPESGMIQQVSYRGEESLIIDEKTSPIDLLTKSSRITGTIKATPGSVHQLLTLNGLWKESKASAYQQIRDQIHINVHSDPFLSRMDQNLGEQLRNAQKIQNKKQESELSEQIQALREQRDNGKIIIMNYCLMPFVEKTSGSQVEISCDQSARINLIVQRN